MATKSNTQDGCPVKKEDHILPITQVEGACLGMKPPLQSLRNPVPHGEWGNLQEVLKSLLPEKCNILQLGPRSEQQPKEDRPGAPTTELVAPLHLKSEATY